MFLSTTEMIIVMLFFLVHTNTSPHPLQSLSVLVYFLFLLSTPLPHTPVLSHFLLLLLLVFYSALFPVPSCLCPASALSKHSLCPALATVDQKTISNRVLYIKELEHYREEHWKQSWLSHSRSRLALFAIQCPLQRM